MHYRFRKDTNHSNFRIKHILSFVSLALLFNMLLLASLPLLTFALTAPTLKEPANSAINVTITNVVFKWQASDNATYYNLDIATDTAFNSIKANTLVDAPDTTYTYTGQLQKDTKYYWRVIAYTEDMSEEKTSSTFSFTTGSSATTTPPVTTSNTTSPAPTSTNNPPSTDGASFIDTITGFIDDVGLPLFLGMVIIFIVFIVLLFILLGKPKKSPSGIPPGMGGPQQRNMRQEQMIACPTCGFMNGSDRRFCANCGSSVFVGQPPPPPPPPPQYQPQQFQTQHFQGGQRFSPGPSFNAQQGTVCSTCGTPNQAGKAFCGTCGSRLAPPMQQNRQSQQQFQQAIFCQSCGAPSQPGQQFCGNCGNAITGTGAHQQVVGSYQTFACPICGATINQGLNPCPSCGTWLDWGR